MSRYSYSYCNHHTSRNESTMTVRVMCALVFVVFCFLWLYFFQADVLYITQHALSGGQTRYGRLWGAVIITLLLFLVQIGVYKLTRLDKNVHALTWFPSMLLLTVLTSANQDIDVHFTFGPWLWLFPLLLAGWGACVWMLNRKDDLYERPVPSGLFSRRMWINQLTMALMICGVGFGSNTNAVFHFRTHAEVALLYGDDAEALRVGGRSLETDGHLMMVRMYALSRQGLLGERLFAYPLVPSSDMMLPTTSATRFMIYPSDSLYRHVGAIPRREMRPMDYLQTIIRHGQAKPAAVDYLLCGYLIDRDLDSFAREIGRYYTVNDSLPRHYREALVLYTHQRNHPVLVYHDPVLDVDYKDLRKLEAEYPLPDERKGRVMEQYADSYWCYYSYGL